MSVVVQPPPKLRRPVILTAFAAVAIAESIFTLTAAQARLKWPNDLLIGGKKICGILIEQHANTVILGIGLNLTQTSEEFLSCGLPDATSLRMISGKQIEQRLAAEVILHRLDREYQRLLSGEKTAVESDWKWRVGLLGQQVEIELTDGSSLAGRLHEMGFDGMEVEVEHASYRVIQPEAVAHIRKLGHSV